MKRSLALLAIGMIVALTGGEASSQDATTWRLTQVVGQTTSYYTRWTVPFSEKVEELTDGALTIEPFPAGVIAPAFEAYAAVRDGLADVGHLTPLYVVNENPANSFFGGQPGGMPPEMFMNWLYEGDGLKLLQEMRREQWGMHSLVLGVGPGEIWHSHKKIVMPEDLSGVRFRASGAWAEVLSEYFEAAPTTVPGSEVYTLLERKGIDAAEWSTPSENKKAGLQNAAPYVIAPGPHTNAFMFELMVPVEKWDALPESVRTRVEAAAKLVTFQGALSWMNADVEAMQAWREAGVEFVQISQELNDAITEAGRKWAYARAEEEEADGNPFMRRIADSYYSFMESWEENAVYRLAE